MSYNETVIRIDLDVILNLSPELESTLIERANDREALGVDDLAEPITTLAEAVAELVMFDPAYLFSNLSDVTGWVAVPAKDAV